jgi:hypothetical protein
MEICAVEISHLKMNPVELEIGGMGVVLPACVPAIDGESDRFQVKNLILFPYLVGPG